MNMFAFDLMPTISSRFCRRRSVITVVYAAKQELVMFHELSAGSAFWLPHGARIYNKLIDFIKDHYWKRGYTEIIARTFTTSTCGINLVITCITRMACSCSMSKGRNGP
jgi:hypothetical protein